MSFIEYIPCSANEYIQVNCACLILFNLIQWKIQSAPEIDFAIKILQWLIHLASAPTASQSQLNDSPAQGSHISKIKKIINL